MNVFSSTPELDLNALFYHALASGSSDVDILCSLIQAPTRRDFIGTRRCIFVNTYLSLKIKYT